MCLLLGENATDAIPSVCFPNNPISVPVSTSQMPIVLSAKPETTSLLSGENATDVIRPPCPWNGSFTGFPVSASQMRTVRSLEPEAMHLPLGENATDQTVFVCPLNMKMQARVRRRGSALHKRRMVAFTYNP